MRERISLDHGWRFQLGDEGKISRDLHRSWYAKAGGVGGAAAQGFDDAHWEDVDIPHDWAVALPFERQRDSSQEHVFHGFKPIGPLYPETSIGWYRRTLDIPQIDLGRRLSIEFGGVFRDSIVWLNGHYLGRHGSGYTSFRYDISDVAHYGKQNTLVVRADATHHEGWWYEGAGIYRHVWLLKTAAQHVDYNGTFVTSDMRNGRAQVVVRTRLANQSDTTPEAQLTTTVLDPEGRRVARVSTLLELDGWQNEECKQEFEIISPLLWDIDAPHMYNLLSTLTVDGVPVDRYETPFGIRDVRFDADQGFFLNGRHVVLKGVCGHPDHAGIGAALPDELYEFRLRRLKDMGVNAVRSWHCCSTSEWLDACDRLGIMVIDEHRLFGSAVETLSELESMIVRDRNHPSVILWSLGNEEFVQSDDVGARIAQTMKRRVNQLDPSRLTTFGANNDGTDTGINAVVDVRGWNYMYHGGVDEYHQRHPEQPIIILEEASTLCTRGIYADDPERGYVSAYDTHPPHRGAHVWMSAEEWWRYCVARPYLAGGFVWTGFDYRGEPTPYEWPCISSHFGIMDICGFPKDNYYYYQSWWSDKTVLHLLPHWTWPGREGETIDVRCFSNCPRVELFLNGRSLGAKTVPRHSHLRWDVAYEPGILEARAYDNRQQISVFRVTTAGPPNRIRLRPHYATLTNRQCWVAVVDVAILDAAGTVVPTADHLVSFAVDGPGRILGVGNGNPSGHESGHTTRGRAFNGLLQVIVQSGGGTEVLQLQAACTGLPPTPLSLKRDFTVGS